MIQQFTAPVKPEATTSSKAETVNHETAKESTNVSQPPASKSLTNEQRSAKYRSIFDDSDDEGDIFISKPKPIVKQVFSFWINYIYQNVYPLECVLDDVHIRCI